MDSAAAACMVELIEDKDGEANVEAIDGLMKEIPSLTRKIAGKSLPIEVSRLIHGANYVFGCKRPEET